MNSVHDEPQADPCSCSHDTSGRHGDHTHCCTFVEISGRAGTDRAGLVGACHRCDCRFDDMLECPASPMNAGARGDPAGASR